jgi:predicted short-subunit dehydrogenase-like oxidoreductase (DUF2520 family)
VLKLGFIGAGTVGTALAVRLSSQGYPVVAVSSRTRASAGRLAGKVSGCIVYDTSQGVADNAELVFITTPDDAIARVAAQTRWHTGQSVAHCSGADSTAILQPAKDAGANVAGFHPLQTFASIDQAIENIPGSTVALEAEGPLLSDLKDMAGALECSSIVLQPEDKVVYHAAAVIACNYLVTLIKLATDLWQTFDVPRQQAVQALMPLLRGTLHNIETVGIPQCLTGPIARGDAGTVTKHIESLQKIAPDVLSTYLELGLQTIPIAEAKGKTGHEQAQELKLLLSADSSNRHGGGVP